MTGGSEPEFVRIRRLTARQTKDLLQLYREEWWCLGRTLSDVEKMLRHSDEIFGYADRSGRLVAFARVLTDYVYKALILDVIVDPRLRKRGLGRAVMEDLLASPRRSSVGHFELYCLPDMIDYYRRWGFSEAASLKFLRRSGADQKEQLKGRHS